MISCCRSGFLQRSGMLLRCVHLLRNVLAACPMPDVHLMVCMTALRELQLVSPPHVVLLSHALSTAAGMPLDHLWASDVC